MRHSPVPRSCVVRMIPYRAIRCGAVALLTVALVGCASKTRAPVEDRSALPAAVAPPGAPATPQTPVAAEPEIRAPTYTVKRGDTLYQIALDHGLDYKDLAAWNNLQDPNKILIGQVLRVAAPGEAPALVSGVTTTPLKVGPAVSEARPGTI